jgi:hypothetical protein
MAHWIRLTRVLTKVNRQEITIDLDKVVFIAERSKGGGSRLYVDSESFVTVAESLSEIAAKPLALQY